MSGQTATEPWSVELIGDACFLFDSTHNLVDSFCGKNGVENARRIAVCVNACAGLGATELFGGVVPAPNFTRMREQRDALAEALREASDALREVGFDDAATSASLTIAATRGGVV